MLDNINDLKLLISLKTFHNNANLMFNFSLHKYLNRIKFSTTNKRNLNILIPTLTQKIKCLQIFQDLNKILFVFN
jgi:hypothetical protein